MTRQPTQVVLAHVTLDPAHMSMCDAPDAPDGQALGQARRRALCRAVTHESA